MKLIDLQHALRAADPAAVLVSPRVLDRVIQEVSRLPNVFWSVPHRQSFVVDRQLLFRHVEQDELELESDRLLPPTVILLARPSGEQLGGDDPEGLLLKYWQRLFHAKIHLALEARVAEGTLTLADVRDRVEQIGPVEFDEIRSVLAQDKYLLPDAAERSVYIEFAATFLDLLYFSPDLLPIYFPGLRDIERVRHVLTRDVDAQALYEQARLVGAPDPSVRAADRPDESQEFYWKLVHSSERAAKSGNLVRAAIIRMKAARVAPGALSFGTRSEAIEYLRKLLNRLQVALNLTDAETEEWMKDLPTLLDKADQGTLPVEADLLFDLQKTVLDFERDVYALDVVEWLLSAGRRPIQRPLPSQRSVLVIKHLRSAAGKVSACRLSDADREHFGGLIQTALDQGENRLRAKFRPVLSTALHDVGLVPADPIERTAFNKVIEDILDRILQHGFLTYGDLRDTISRNQLKLRDLHDPREFIRGDPLLRLDRRLATLLDGVYRPSEVYLRVIERATALGFGTATGRVLTRFVLLPFGTAFAILEGFKLLLEVVGLKILGWEETAYWATFGTLSVFFLLVYHHRGFRRRCVRALKRCGDALRVVFIDLPLKLLRVRFLKRLMTSWPIQLFYWYLLKPAAVCFLLWYWWPEAFETLLGAAGIFVAVYVLLNSRAGLAVQEGINQAVYRLLVQLRAGLLVGLVRLMTHVLKQVTDAIEYCLFSIDEWLWFRSGEGRAALITRTLLSVIWFPIGYVLRFILVVLIEPGYNPLKAPVSYLAAKFMLPITTLLWIWWWEVLQGWPAALFGIVYAIGWLVIFHLPDVFGFIFWEMKENWRLYRANRPREVGPVPVGSHGETVRRLLRPGFHSGTVPKLYGKLRRAERRARVTGNWRRSRATRETLHEVQQAVREFVLRELVYLVNQAASWQAQGLSVGKVVLSSNRISIELTHGSHLDRPVWLALEECAGWLVAGVAQAGWLPHLRDEQAASLNTALAQLYKLAGVDVVREQVRANLPGPDSAPATAYEVVRDGLAVWQDRRHGSPVLYGYDGQDGALLPTLPNGEPAPDWPPVAARRVFYAALPLTWAQCLRAWEKDQEGEEHPPLTFDGVELSLLGEARPPLLGAVASAPA